MKCMVDKMALGGVFLREFRVSSVTFIPPLLRTQLHLHVALTGRSKVQSLGTVQRKQNFG